MEKNHTITVRLSENEINGLNTLTKGPLSRSQIMRVLLQDFLEKSKDEQQQFLVKRLFGPSRLK